MGRLSERDRTSAALLSTDMSGFHIALAVFAFNFAEVRRQKASPLDSTDWIADAESPKAF